MKAVILAGGKGTRLKGIAEDTPKPMVRIGDKPILQHQIELLHRYGINNIILIVGHLSDAIRNYFGDGSDFGVKVDYFVEDKPLGTTGGIKEIEEQLDGDFIVFYGDVMLDMNLDKLVEFHKNRDSVATLVLHPNDHPYDSDLVEINDAYRIIKFHSKPHVPDRHYKNLVNSGVYVFSSKLLKYIEKGVKADFGKDILPAVVSRESLYGYISAEYIKDMGTPDRFNEVNQAYISGKIQQLNCKNPRAAIFLDRDGVINKFVGLLSKIEDFTLYEDVSGAIRKINDSEYLAVVITNQPVVARNLCSIEGLEEIHKKMDTLLGRQGAKLDALYYCPHHPDKGYPEENPKYKIECDCRKPKTGLITKAQKEFNIDLARSYFIGDSDRDVACGKNAGLITVGLTRGEDCRNGDVKPDYIFDTLSEAVNFILSGNKK